MLAVKKTSFNFIFITIIVLISIRFWSLKLIPDAVFDILDILIVITLFTIVFLNLSVLKKMQLPFNINVKLFIIIPLISGIGALVFHGQAYYLSIYILRTNFYWLLYFVLHIYNIPPKKIITLMMVLGVIWAIITVIQQFTYPSYLFFSRITEDDDIEFRAGVYRFMVYRHHFGVFLMIFSGYKFFKTRKNIYLLLIFIGLAGFYYFGTRQFGVAAIICMLLTAFFQEGNKKLIAFVIILLLGVLAFYFSDFLFSEYITMTADQLHQDYVRVAATYFYLLEYWPHWFAYIIGNGREHGSSAYGREILNISDMYGFYRSDIGIIGAFNTFGIFYSINMIWINIKGLQSKWYKKENRFLKLLFVNALLTILMTEYYSHVSAIPFFCLTLYLVEKQYQSKLIS